MFKLALLLVATALLTPPLPAQQGQETSPESYTATAMGTGGPAGGKSIQFDFRVTRYATDEEVGELAQLVKDKGTDALRRALEKLDAGRITPVGSVGNQIAVARKRQDGPDTVITIVTARIMPFAELYRAGRTTDYPFGYLQVRLNDKSQGAGQIMVAAKIRFNKKKGIYEIESFGNQYIKATNVRPNR
jgi:hypothetical protein